MRTQPEIYRDKDWPESYRYFKSVERTNKILLKFFDEPITSGRFLDIGAWDGSLEKLLPPQVDYHPLDMVKIEHKNAKQVDLNKERIPYPDDYFDFIFADQVLEHTLRPIHILNEIRRVLKPSGKALIGLPDDDGLLARLDFLYVKFESIENQYGFHHWNFTHENSVKFLKDGGFKIIKEAGLFLFASKIFIGLSPITFYKVRK